MVKRIILFAVVLTMMLSSARAQEVKFSPDTSAKLNVNGLIGLKKAEPGDIDPNTPLMLNPSTTPIYFDDFSAVKEDDFMKIMMSGDYIPEPYIDNTKSVKAFVLRKASAEEKAKMKEMQGKMEDPSEKKSDLIGKEAFPFSVTDLSGKKYSLDKLKGKVVVMNFWFVECKPCVMEMPELNGLVEKYKGQEVVFIGFSTSDQGKIDNFLKTKTFEYNIVPDSKEVASRYKVNFYPTHVIINKNSIIIECITGLSPTTVKELDQAIESLLK